MIGDFEMPGDEARTERVGGGPGSPEQQGSQQQPGGGGGMPPLTPGGQQAAGAESGGQPPLQAPQGAPIAGQGDPNAKAEGAQVSQLQTDPNAGGQSGEAMPPKPQPVTIGDSAMQIQTTASSAGAVGTNQAGQTQQMEKDVGGGKGSSTIQSGPGGAEKGRAIPAGL